MKQFIMLIGSHVTQGTFITFKLKTFRSGTNTINGNTVSKFDKQKAIL